MALLVQNNVHLGPMNIISRSDCFGSGHYYNNNNNNNYLSEYGYYSNINNNNIMMMEKRQLFLRSYQFCRKQSFSGRIKRSLVRVKRVIWLRLKSARRFRKLACFRIRCGFSYRRRRFIRLLNNSNNNKHTNNNCFT